MVWLSNNIPRVSEHPSTTFFSRTIGLRLVLWKYLSDNRRRRIWWCAQFFCVRIASWCNCTQLWNCKWEPIIFFTLTGRSSGNMNFLFPYFFLTCDSEPRRACEMRCYLHSNGLFHSSRRAAAGNLPARSPLPLLPSSSTRCWLALRFMGRGGSLARARKKLPKQKVHIFKRSTRLCKKNMGSYWKFESCVQLHHNAMRTQEN